MSNFYLARVSNAGLDAIRSDFRILVKADSLAKARAGVANSVIEVERATDSEIFEAGRNGNVVLDLSALPTDDSQLSLPMTRHAVDMTQPSAHDGTVEAVECGGEAPPVLVGARATPASAPSWLPQGNAVNQNTGD